jgi:hypothetical protein
MNTASVGKWHSMVGALTFFENFVKRNHDYLAHYKLFEEQNELSIYKTVYTITECV